jgi:hypothetical protein
MVFPADGADARASACGVSFPRRIFHCRPMPLQNRVTPMGEIVAAPQRGMFVGNRGIIHDGETRTLLNRRWSLKAWLTCTLHWKDVRRRPMSPGTWTELFFLDEATALAAGHRPCFYCRRVAAKDFLARFGDGTAGSAGAMDAILHRERLDGRGKRLHPPPHDLPDGAMVMQDGGPHLVLAGQARPWSLDGYGPAVAVRHDGQLVTPPSTLAALARGYRPVIHPSAGGR